MRRIIEFGGSINTCLWYEITTQVGVLCCSMCNAKREN